MEPELDFQEKVRLDQEAVVVVIYTCSLMSILMIYLKDLMKTYSLNVQYLLQMLLLEHQLKFQRLMVVKLKLKFPLEHKVENNSG